MKLTPFGKLFIALVALGVIGFVVYKRFGDELRTWAGATTKATIASGEAKGGATVEVTKDDFNAIHTGLVDAPRQGGVEVKPGGAVADQRLSRTLRVGINTWAGHAPGIVANGGMEVGSPSSLYKKKYGLDVEFVLLEDPSAKLAAFIKGDIDIMWDTVDSYAREASELEEKGFKARAIIQEDWSRGGDGIVSLKSIQARWRISKASASPPPSTRRRTGCCCSSSRSLGSRPKSAWRSSGAWCGPTRRPRPRRCSRRARSTRQ